jgi:dsRNA-specific ribonuclease
MTSIFIDELTSIFGKDLENHPILKTAFDIKTNQSIAEIGDCVLNLVIKELAFYKSNSTPESITKAQQDYANKYRNQEFLNKDVEFTRLLVRKCQSPVGNIGLKRSDTFVEAIIGAVFISNDYETTKTFVKKTLELKI